MCPCRFIPQFGNTCYCNSVPQALYFCRPFRENVLAYKAQQKKKENLLTCLADLFHSIATQKKKVGVIPPKKFISRLRKENGESPYLRQKKLQYMNSKFWLEMKYFVQKSVNFCKTMTLWQKALRALQPMCSAAQMTLLVYDWCTFTPAPTL